MVFEIIKKQWLTFMRDPKQLFLLLMLPIILISILSASLSGFISGDSVDIDVKVALIEHENEDKQIAHFIQEIDNGHYPKEVKKKLKQSAKQFPFVQLLKKEALTAIEFTEVHPDGKEAVLKNDEHAAVIEVPAQFTYDTLKSTLLDETEPGEVHIYGNEGTLGAEAVNSIIQSYQEFLSMTVFAMNHGIDPTHLQLESVFGKRSPVGKSNPINAREYYTIGMAVMNVLYIATAVGSFAFLEKESQIFNRIILSDVSRWTYFGGVFASGAIFGFLQLLFIFGFSWIIYGVTWPVLSFLLTTVCIALAVGGLAVVLAAVSYRFNSESVINFFSTALVAILALIGGSFFPIGDLSALFQSIGDFTPNGAGMSAYLSLLRGEKWMDIVPHLSYLLIFTGVFVVIALFSFPKRGEI